MRAFNMKKISKIEFKIIEVPAPEFPPAFQGIHIAINGKDFLTLVSDFEKPYMVADGFKNFEERRTWPIAHKNNLMTLRGARGYYQYYSIIDCTCQCDGCWPLNGKIIRTATLVKWKSFCNGHKKHWPYHKLGPFYFDRKQYDEQLAKIEPYIKRPRHRPTTYSWRIPRRLLPLGKRKASPRELVRVGRKRYTFNILSTLSA